MRLGENPVLRLPRGGRPSHWMDEPLARMIRKCKEGLTAWQGVGTRAVRQWNSSHRDNLATADITGTQACRIYMDWRFRCAYCGDRPRGDTSNYLCLDHMTPLSRGGDHSAHNVVPACNRCNTRKLDMTAMEFACWCVGLIPNRDALRGRKVEPGELLERVKG